MQWKSLLAGASMAALFATALWVSSDKEQRATPREDEAAARSTAVHKVAPPENRADEAGVEAIQETDDERRAESAPFLVRSAADVPDAAINADIARNTLATNRFRLIPVELDCSPKQYQEIYCVPTAASSISNHPYYSYPLESLLLIHGDPIAHQVISMRITREDPDAALQHAIWATGLSGGRPEPLVDFVRQSGWSAVSEGEPIHEAFAQGYVVWEAAERLGYPVNVADAMLPILRERFTEAEMAAVEASVADLLNAIAAVPVAREWEERP